MPNVLALLNLGTELDVEALRPVLQPLCAQLRVRRNVLLANPHSAEHAHRAIVLLTRPQGKSTTPGKSQIGVAESELQAVHLAEISDPEYAVIAESVYLALPPESRTAYLPPEDVGGYRVCRQLPRGRRCFCILPIGPAGSDQRAYSDFVFERIIVPACRSLQYFPVHPVRENGENVWADITNGLLGAELVVAFLGTEPWNPNVMLELGYRMATSKPLVVLGPDVTLPFDLRNYRAIVLPEKAREMTDDQVAEKVDELMHKMSERTKHDLGWGDLYPTATIEVDTRPKISDEERDHKVGDASHHTARLFAIPRDNLIGASPGVLLDRLAELMDASQHKAFLEEQARLYAELGNNPSLARGRRQTVFAEVPMVLTRHPDPDFFFRAYLPAVLSHQQIEQRSPQRVVYIDVSRHVRQDERGVYRVDAPGPNIDLLFARYAEAYDAVLPGLPNYMASMDEHCALLEPSEGMKVLDLGAGTGNITVRLLRAGARVTALDLSAEMLRVLRRKCNGQGDRLRVVNRDGGDLSMYPTGTFDAVNIHLVLFSARHPRQILKEATRVLRPGGVLVVTEPNQHFDMNSQLEAAENYLRQQGRLETLRESWELVKKVNLAFRTALDEGWRAETVERELRYVNWEDITTSAAYGEQCTTLRAIKPEAI
jgi:ubiquinone/menaquinone biosynthesis C-methylase UbiE